MHHISACVHQLHWNKQTGQDIKATLHRGLQLGGVGSSFNHICAGLFGSFSCSGLCVLILTHTQNEEKPHTHKSTHILAYIQGDPKKM